MNILRLGSLAYSHYLDRFAVPYIPHCFPGIRIKTLLSVHFTFPEIKPNSIYLDSWAGRGKQGGSSHVSWLKNELLENT